MQYYTERKECLKNYDLKAVGLFKPNLWVFKKTKGWSKIDITLLNEVKNPRLFYIGEQPPVDIEPSTFDAVLSNKKFKKTFQDSLYFNFYEISKDPLSNSFYITEIEIVKSYVPYYLDSTLKFTDPDEAEKVCSFLNTLLKLFIIVS